MWNAVFRLAPRSLKDRLRSLMTEASRRSLEPELRRLEEQSKLLRSQTESQAEKLHTIESRLADMDTLVGQLLAGLAREESIPPPPPKHLQIRVVGKYVARFIDSGFFICDDLDAVLGGAGKRLSDFERILDFGCGCGRMSRALKARAPSSELHGADIDPEAMAWVQQNYARFAEYRLFPLVPPTPYSDSFFDLVIGISVFTHLPEDMQFAWLDELHRITKPGGYLVLTTIGEKGYKREPPEIQEIVNRKGFFYKTDEPYGETINLPAFYQNTYHAHHYIRREWAKTFEILDIQTTRIDNHQDAILLRKRP